MPRSTDENQTRRPPLFGCRVFIVGPRQISGALISFYLEKEGQADCEMFDGLEEAAKTMGGENDSPEVLLWDVQGLDGEEVANQLEEAEIPPEIRVTLFNVDPESKIERAALGKGVKGFFYQGDSPEFFLKGMGCIVAGELWVSRKIMERCLLENGVEGRPAAARQALLTDREIEILHLISKGARNAEIADHLCISLHTVKAHVYNTFKKIKVSNRLQAARWASENLY